MLKMNGEVFMSDSCEINTIWTDSLLLGMGREGGKERRKGRNAAKVEIGVT